MKVESNSKIAFEVFLELTEEETRALNAISGKSSEPLLEQLLRAMERTYLEPHIRPLTSFFTKVRELFPSHIKRFDLTRNTFNTENPNK
jgi:hypothetical protein